MYIYGKLCNISNKEWIEEYKIDVFLEKQYLNGVYTVDQYKKKLDKDTQYQNNILLLDMPREMVCASMKDIYTDDKNRLETIKWLTTFIKKYESGEKCKGLYLTGNFGCGKTYLVAAAFNELAKKGKNVAVVYYPEFLRSLKENTQ